MRHQSLFSVWIKQVKGCFRPSNHYTQGMTNHTFIGVDISKATFDFYFNDHNSNYGKLHNHQEGFEVFINMLPQDPWVVMEASGPYYYQLACFLSQQGIPVSVVNPLVIKRFSQMKLQRTKSDKADARIISEYAHIATLRSWRPPSEDMHHLQQLFTTLEQVIKQRTALGKQMMAFQATGSVDEQLLRLNETWIAQLESTQKELEKMIEEKVDKQSASLRKNLQSIPGIGPKTSILLIVSCKGFIPFQHYKQVISYLGLAPRIYQSGTSVRGRARICKMGMGKVRACLYMAARSARRHNTACRRLYDRLRAKGKPHRVAMIAVANKLIKQAFAIVKSGVKYQDDFGSFDSSKQNKILTHSKTALAV